MSLKHWLWLHRWSSLVCTLFLLLLCLTGLPLVFQEEIEHALQPVSIQSPGAEPLPWSGWSPSARPGRPAWCCAT